MTKLTLQVENTIFSWETNCNDCSVGEILQGLHGLMVGHSFCSETVLKGMRNYVEENELS
jgi:pyridoxine 5'-phosphate synthase PdxJ